MKKITQTLLSILLVSAIHAQNLFGVESITNEYPSFDKIISTSYVDEVNGLIYFGGGFTQVGDSSRSGLVAIDIISKEILPINIDFGSNYVINSIAQYNNDLIIGGQFTTVNNLARTNLVKVNKNTGVVDPNFIFHVDGNMNSAIEAVAIEDDMLYIGGLFDTINNDYRSRVAAINLLSNTLTNWLQDTLIAGRVRDIEIDDDYIHLGGITMVLQSNSSEPYVYIAVDKNTNSFGFGLNNFQAGSGDVFKVKSNGNDIYLGGGMRNINNQAINKLCKLNKTTGLVDNSFNISNFTNDFSEIITDLDIVNNHLYALRNPSNLFDNIVYEIDLAADTVSYLRSFQATNTRANTMAIYENKLLLGGGNQQVNSFNAIRCIDTLVVDGCLDYTSPAGITYTQEGFYTEIYKKPAFCGSNEVVFDVKLNEIDTNFQQVGDFIIVDENPQNFDEIYLSEQTSDCNSFTGNDVLSLSDSIAIPQSGNYAVIILYNNQNCFYRSDCLNLLTCDSVNLQISNATVSDTICANDAIGSISVDASTNVSSTLNYEWTSTNFNENTQNIENLAPGVYELTISDERLCQVNNTYEILSYEEFTNEIIADSNFLSINIVGNTGPYSHEWEGPNGFSDTSESISNASNGIYTLISTDVNGCKSSTSFELNYNDNLTSITSILNDNIKLYPNPTQNILNIELVEVLKVEIYNVTGLKIAELNGQNNYQFNTSALANGLYFVKAGEQTLKFVKN